MLLSSRAERKVKKETGFPSFVLDPNSLNPKVVQKEDGEGNGDGRTMDTKEWMDHPSYTLTHRPPHP